MNSKKYFAFLAILFLLLGFLGNTWVVGQLFFEDKQVDLISHKILIWSFQFFFLGFGTYLLARRRSLNSKHLLFSMIAVTGALVTIEAGLHTANFIRDSVFQRWHEAEEIEITENPPLPMEYEPFIEWRQKELRKTWNPDTSQVKEPKQIFVFGGSTTWGVYVPEEATIPSYLSKKLFERGFPAIVHNYGELGHTFTQEIVRLILLLREGHRPDYVFFYDGANDVDGAFEASGIAGSLYNYFEINEKIKMERMTNSKHILMGVKGLIEEHSLIYRSILNMVSHLAPHSQRVPWTFVEGEAELKNLASQIVDYHSKSLDLLDHLSKSYGFKYLCFWQPVIYTEDKMIGSEENLKPKEHEIALAKLFHYTNEFLQNKPPSKFFFNLTDVLKKRQEPYYNDFCHLTKKGNEAVAETMVQILLKD